VRGEDLIDSTHRVLAIREAMGVEDRPQYAHLPLIVDTATRAKLSKRHGAVGLEDFRDEGYLPEALMNYIALLGWAPPEDGDEVLDAAGLVAAFDLDRVTHSAAGFDRAKLDWLNGEWMRRVSVAELVARLEPAARERFGDRLDGEVFTTAVGLAQERSVTLRAALDQMDFLFVADDDLVITEDSWAKLTGTDRVTEILDVAVAHVESCEWTLDAINLKAPIEETLGLKLRKAAPALYAAVEGRHQGLPLFDSIHLLGRERALARLRRARMRLG
jgi:glutamyl-tRNA synthetase